MASSRDHSSALAIRFRQLTAPGQRPRVNRVSGFDSNPAPPIFLDIPFADAGHQRLRRTHHARGT